MNIFLHQLRMISKRVIQVTLIILTFLQLKCLPQRFLCATIFDINRHIQLYLRQIYALLFEYFKSMSLRNGYKYVFTQNQEKLVIISLFAYLWVYKERQTSLGLTVNSKIQ